MKEFFISNKKLIIIFGIIIIIGIIFLFFNSSKQKVEQEKVLLKCDSFLSYKNTVDMNNTIEISEKNGSRKFVGKIIVNFTDNNISDVKHYQDIIELQFIQNRVYDDVDKRYEDVNSQGFTFIFEFNIDSLSRNENLKRVFGDINLNVSDLKDKFESEGMKCQSF